MRNMARKETLATPCIFLRERLFGWGRGERHLVLLFVEQRLYKFQRVASVGQREEAKAVNTHSLSSSYMGRMAGWHTKAKVRMGTA